MSGLFRPRTHTANRSHIVFDDRSAGGVFGGKLSNDLETQISVSGETFLSKYDQEQKKLGSMYNLLATRYSQSPSPFPYPKPPCLAPSAHRQLSYSQLPQHLASEQSWAGDGVCLRLVRIVYDSRVSRLVCAGERDLRAWSRAGS